MNIKTDLRTLTIPVSHYSGCGNDFLLIDNRDQSMPELSKQTIEALCTAQDVDGLIMVCPSKSADMAMKYYNRDGLEADMCGNGTRCLMQFMRQKRSFEKTRCILETKLRDLIISTDDQHISVHMGPVHDYGWDIALEHDGRTYHAHHLNTGVPHIVIFVDDVANLDVAGIGKAFRYHEKFMPQGTNVNFVQQFGDSSAHIRTYERGVEAETLACGTGVTAAARCLQKLHNQQSPIALRVQSGEKLEVFVEEKNGKVENAILKGPATWIADGIIELDLDSQNFVLTINA